MTYARKLILHTPLADPEKLDSFVEHCLANGIVLIAVLDPDADKVEDLIDELVVGDASDKSRFVMTSHRNSSLDEVLDFVGCYDAGPGVQIQQVRFQGSFCESAAADWGMTAFRSHPNGRVDASHRGLIGNHTMPVKSERHKRVHSKNGMFHVKHPQKGRSDRSVGIGMFHVKHPIYQCRNL